MSDDRGENERPSQLPTRSGPAGSGATPARAVTVELDLPGSAQARASAVTLGMGATHISARRSPDSAPPEGETGRPALAPIAGVPRYRVDQELGHGGMGAVYRAWDLDLDRAVALKVLLDELSRDPEFAARFIEEAQVAAKLQHPAVVPVYDVGADAEGKLYFTMKLVDGKTLTAIVLDARDGVEAAREYTPFRLLEVFREIGRAVAYVHEQGIVHRDLKPDNVMLGRHGEVLVMDWGIAKTLSKTTASPDVATIPRGTLPQLERAATAYGSVVGTPAFMAPEQATGESPVSPSWDVYALGGILHYLLTGRIAESVETANGGRGESGRGLRPPRALDPRVPPEVDAICMKALAYQPEDRYPSAQALVDDIQAYLEQRPVSALPEGPLRRAAKWVRRRRRSLMAVGLGAIGLGVAAASSRAVTAHAALGEARDQAKVAAETFATARAQLPAGAQDPAALRSGRDRLLGLGMNALQSAQVVSALAPRDALASLQVFEAALSLGDVALDDQQWGLAASAYERAQEAHVDDARAARASSEVERARTRVADEHRHTIDRILAEAQREALDDAHYQDALFALVGLSEPATVERLAQVLDGVSAELWAARRQFFLRAQTLTQDEELRGEQRIAGLEDALDRLPSQVGTDLPPPLHAAKLRLQAREEASTAPGATPPSFRRMSAIAQAEAVGNAKLRLAHLAAEALGRIGIAHGAVEALTRYVRAEDDEVGAAPAAIALCLLAQPESEERLLLEQDRMGGANSWFWTLVRPYFGRFAKEGDGTLATAEQYVKRAKSRGAKGDLAGAVRDATRATELDPQSVSAWITLRVAHRHAGDLPAAIADSTRAVELAPLDPKAWNDKGFAELEHGDLDVAIADLDRSLALRPISARTQTHRAEALRLKGELPTALAASEAAVRADPRFEWAYRVRGAIHRDQHAPRVAIADYDQAIAIDPRSAEAWAGRAMARLDSKELDAALEDATRAVELDSKSGPSLLARARVLQARGEGTGALADAQRAVDLEQASHDAEAAQEHEAQGFLAELKAASPTAR